MRSGFLGKTVSFNDLGEDTLFSQGTNRLSTERHGHFLAVDFKGLLLKVWFEDAVCATQREAHIVAELFTFSG